MVSSQQSKTSGTYTAHTHAADSISEECDQGKEEELQKKKNHDLGIEKENVIDDKNAHIGHKITI